MGFPHRPRARLRDQAGAVQVLDQFRGTEDGTESLLLTLIRFRLPDIVSGSAIRLQIAPLVLLPRCHRRQVRPLLADLCSEVGTELRRVHAQAPRLSIAAEGNRRRTVNLTKPRRPLARCAL